MRPSPVSRASMASSNVCVCDCHDHCGQFISGVAGGCFVPWPHHLFGMRLSVSAGMIVRASQGRMASAEVSVSSHSSCGQLIFGMAGGCVVLALCHKPQWPNCICDGHGSCGNFTYSVDRHVMASCHLVAVLLKCV